MWISFQVKAFYNRASQYRLIKDLLMGERYGLSEDEIYISGDGVYENEYCDYVFVKCDEKDCASLWEKLSREKFIRAKDGYCRIGDESIEKMRSSARKNTEDDIYRYDIVKMLTSPYERLYGIVLELPEGDGRYEIGFNLCTGSRREKFAREAFERVKSLFEEIKFEVEK